MSDVTASDANLPAPSPDAASGGVPSGPSYLAQGLGAARLGAGFLKRGDLGLAFAVMFILVVLILPMPAIMLDFLLAISITFSVLVMMTALFIRTPLEFSSFPTILLIATMMRLALNLASTRLILSEGHTGTDAAGEVIEAFGGFVMGGNLVIGLIVFAILVIVNFVVITKGSGRIAEVAARFTLDSMPGKQMAIDADLSAGLIDEKEAKQRRETLENESSFFGAMDGASKFVRGDAVAGLLITAINLVGGLVVGMMQKDLSFSEAGQVYSLLTIGDGLVSQIPALIVSTAAGLLISKAGVKGEADKALVGQLSGYPKALGMSAGAMAIMAVLPGIPFIPFIALAGLAGWLAYTATRRDQRTAMQTMAKEALAANPPAPKEAPISDTLAIDALKIELGYGLLSLINAQDGQDRLSEQIKALRRQVAGDFGFVMPPVRIIDNVQLDANAYVIRVKEVDSGQGTVYPDQYMVMDPRGGRVELPGIHTTEPTFGLPATWIDGNLRDEAAMKGYTVVDLSTVLSTHLTEIIKANMDELLTYGDVQTLLRDLPESEKKLAEDLVPSQVSVTAVQRILQQLLSERVSIRDFSTILEGIAEVAGTTNDPGQMVEHVRGRLARQICAQHMSPNGYLPLIQMSPHWEAAFAESIIGEGQQRRLTMAPSKLQDFVVGVRDAFEEAGQMGEVPVLLTSGQARPFVRSIVERFRAQTAVVSQNEVHPRVRLKTVASV